MGGSDSMVKIDSNETDDGENLIQLERPMALLRQVDNPYLIGMNLKQVLDSSLVLHCIAKRYNIEAPDLIDQSFGASSYLDRASEDSVQGFDSMLIMCTAKL